MFDRQDFEVFADETLAGRLAKIRQQLDPKFQIAGEQMQALMSQNGLPKQSLHIAKHLRRHKNPPPNTWLALAPTARGYKMVPHVELGFWDDRLFLWVALLAESKPLALDWAHLAQLSQRLPEPFELSGDHTQKAVLPLNHANFQQLAARFEKTKKGEFLIGQTYLAENELFAQPDALWADVLERCEMLMPLYQACLDAYLDKA